MYHNLHYPSQNGSAVLPIDQTSVASDSPEPEIESNLTIDEIKTLNCVSANVQKSAENTGMLLERYMEADIICVQEIYWGQIKKVASNTSKDGDSYENTVSH